MNPIVKRIVTALTTATLAVLAIIYAPVSILGPVVGLLIVLSYAEYLLLLRQKLGSAAVRAPVRCLGGLGVLFLLLALPLTALHHGNLMMLYIIAIVKFSDMGGFAVGMTTARLMKGGNHKLCPTISPNKSWEGLAGSVVASVVMSLAFLPVTHFAWTKALSFGVIAALIGTFGDLVESQFKRWVGVKDSATFMPAGLGGFLDMFDSLLFAPAILYPLI